MPTISQVAPGDLITADLFNKLIAAINGLDGRLTDVENEKPEPQPQPVPGDSKDHERLLRLAAARVRQAKGDEAKIAQIVKALIEEGVPVDDSLAMLSDNGVDASVIQQVRDDLEI